MLGFLCLTYCGCCSDCVDLRSAYFSSLVCLGMCLLQLCLLVAAFCVWVCGDVRCSAMFWFVWLHALSVGVVCLRISVLLLLVVCC